MLGACPATDEAKHANPKPKAMAKNRFMVGSRGKAIVGWANGRSAIRAGNDAAGKLNSLGALHLPPQHTAIVVIHRRAVKFSPRAASIGERPPKRTRRHHFDPLSLVLGKMAHIACD
jgi:hypothetical protein